MFYLVFHKENNKKANLDFKIGFKGTKEECAKEFRKYSKQARKMGEHTSGVDRENRVWFKVRKPDGSSMQVWFCNEEQAKQLVF